MAKRGTSYASNNPLMLNDQSWDREAVMAIICEQIATSSNGLATILKRGHDGHTLPDYTTIMAWLDADAELSNKYARAKADQADYMADEMLAIADDATNDYMDRLGPDGQPIGYQLNGDHVQRARLRLDTRKWLASKLKPKKYGEKVEMNHSGEMTIASITRKIVK